MSRMRRLVTTVVLGLLAGAGLTVMSAGVAQAHGAPTAPGSRTFLCYTDGHWTGGDLEPRNPACQNAIVIGGKQPLWDWFAVLRSDGAGRTRGFIPDGQLCSGGNPKYAAYDVARDDWPVTHLTAGATWTYHHNAWAPHPGTFRLFVTRDGYDPTQPLTWDSLEPEPFSTWSETTPDGTGEYVWDVTLPAGKTGRHIIYAVWARSDSQETFYNCSDVVFDGGNGEVTGFPAAGTAPTTTATAPGPTTTTTTAPGATTTTTAPGTTTTAPGGTAPVPGGTTPAPGGTTGTTAVPPGGSPGSCSAMVNVQSWPGGYLGTVVVADTGAAAGPWTVTFQVAPGVSLYTGWNATTTLRGQVVTAAAPAWNPSLDVGEQVSIGFVAAGPAVPAPGDVRLDGVPCQGV